MNKLFLEENVRDLGGYISNNEKYTKYNKIIRGNLIDDTKMEKIEYLVDYGVQVVIDIRRSLELGTRISGFEKDDNTVKYNISLNDNIWGEDYFVLDINERYTAIIEKNKEAICEIFNVIYDNIDKCILIHCSIGKDRTGILAALLLMLCDVDKEDIGIDYNDSEDYVLETKGIEEMQKDGCYKDRMIYFVDYINNKYGDIKKYLMSCGLEINKINKIKEELVEEII